MISQAKARRENLMQFWNPLLKAGKIGYAFSRNFSSVLKLQPHKVYAGVPLVYI